MLRVVFLVNGSPESAMGIRAQSFACELSDFQIFSAYRTANKLGSIVQFLRQLIRFAPTVVYVFDMSYSGVAAALLYRLVRRCRVVIDTGDAITELARSMGKRNWLGRTLTQLLETVSIRCSDALVVRSHYHRELLSDVKKEIWVIPDGVDVESFRPMDASPLRAALGLGDSFTVGLVGSMIWNETWEICYGWELVEALRGLRDLPIKAVFIGDGNGLERLKTKAREAGVAEQSLFLGRLRYEELPGLLNCLDICLSTQSNDLAGQVRTTGKLPLYLACGRYVISTEVGEAKRILPPEMLLPYTGVRDDSYPERLAAKIRDVYQRRERVSGMARSRTIAREMFDYRVLAHAVREAITAV